MDMCSMKSDMKKMADKEVKEHTPEYPYGLKLNLDHESIKKLGMEKMPEMGKYMMLHAKVEVTDIHESEGHKSLGLQITDMSLKDDMEKRSTEEVMYGGK